MDAIKVKSIAELDYIMPLIQKLHRYIGIDKYVSITGYMTWIVANLLNPTFAVWYGLKDGSVNWFVICQIQLRAGRLECAIVDACMETVDTGISDEMFGFIEEWARDQKCEFLSCYSKRPGAMERKYGFEEFGTVMIKAI